MKIRMSMKDPDTMHDSVDAAFEKMPKPEGITKDEWDDICVGRAERIESAISEKWMEYGEYLVVEFEIDEDGDAITATVLSNKHQ